MSSEHYAYALQRAQAALDLAAAWAGKEGRAAAAGAMRMWSRLMGLWIREARRR